MQSEAMQSLAVASRATPQLLNLGQGSWQDYVSDDGRPYFVYIPANYQVGTTVPLVETSPGESLHISDLSIRLKILLRHPKGLKSRQDIRNQVR